MRHGSVLRSTTSESPSILRFRIIRASWLATFNDARERNRTDLGVSQQWQLFFISDTRLLFVLGLLSCVSPNLASTKRRKRLYSGIAIGMRNAIP
jgi:hypothetical protein